VTPRVLVVEDDDDFRSMLEIAVSLSSAELVGLASTAAQGIELALEQEPDYILMDVYLPDMTGIEATRVITEKLPGTHIIGFTGFQADDLQEMLAAGATSIYEKTDFQKVLQQIQEEPEASG
jgi:DNA-binding NarL/FixJ family response regulator